MPFGLTNTLSSFQNFINDILHPYLDIFCSTYLNDMIVYSNSLKEYYKHIWAVLLSLKEVGLHLDITKYEFHIMEVKFLGLIISTDSICMDPAKI